jgi:hypothetical protein
MEPDQPVTNAGQAHAPPPSPPSTAGVAPVRPLRLRPLWLGFALTVAGFFLFALAARSADAAGARALAATCALPAFIYYFMMVHRVVRVLDAQPGWSVAYTPAAAVWKHFIPFYGLYFLYRWPADVESYVNWRLGQRSWFAIWTFFGLLAGISLRFWDSYAGLLLMMTSLCFVYVPLRRALAADVAEEPLPGYGGTLGLR